MVYINLKVIIILDSLLRKLLPWNKYTGQEFQHFIEWVTPSIDARIGLTEKQQAAIPKS